MDVHEIIAEVKRDHAARLREAIDNIESTHMAQCLLEKIKWLNVPKLNRYNYGYFTVIVEGDDLASKLNEIRKALNCPLVMDGKSLEGDQIRVVLRPRDYKTVLICYYKPIPAHSTKCKIVEITPKPYKTLVCE